MHIREGRKEIQQARDELKWEKENLQPDMPEDLCYLNGRYLEDYLHDVEICQRFARRNREKMAEILLDQRNLTARIRHCFDDASHRGGAFPCLRESLN